MSGVLYKNNELIAFGVLIYLNFLLKKAVVASVANGAL